MTRHNAQRWTCAWRTPAELLALALLSLPATAAPALADPTQPPAGFAPGGAGAAALPASGAAASLPGAEGALVLQSILSVGSGDNDANLKRRPAAIIGGTLVPLGSRVGAYRLARINAGSVLLQGPNGALELLLVPRPTPTRNPPHVEASR